jgi:hypothetical protein
MIGTMVSEMSHVDAKSRITSINYKSEIWKGPPKGGHYVLTVNACVRSTDGKQDDGLWEQRRSFASRER